MSYGLKCPSWVAAGTGTIKEIQQILSLENAKSVLVCSDKGIEKSGLLSALTQILDSNDRITYQVITDLATEPAYTDVQNSLDHFQGFVPDLIIAIGGGSVMDAGKLFSVLIGADYSVKQLLDQPQLAHKQVKTVMIPTTCGTGSEATCNAIVAVPEKSVKVGIVNNSMIPDYVILDANMLRNLPPKIVASTGVDALAHVVECYTSNKATLLSDIFAVEGAKLIFRNLVDAYRNPDHLQAKEALMIGAYCGGVAITASGTTAVHALSYPLGGKFHIPHGVSNAILFASVMELNANACEDRLASLCDCVFPENSGMTTAEKSQFIIGQIRQIVQKTDIPTDLSAYNVTRADLGFLVKAGSEQKRLLNNNCKNLTLEEIQSIYEGVLK